MFAMFDRFDCDVVSDPVATLTWYFNGVHLTPSDHKRVVMNPTNTTLTIVKVTLQDSGEYLCTAHNALGQSSTRTVLKVKRK